MKLRALYAVMTVLPVLALQHIAWPLINPTFTPIHLAQSQTILALKVKDVGAKLQLEVTSALKGKAPAGIVVDLASAQKETTDAVQKLLANSAKEEALFFDGPPKAEGDDAQAAAFLHIHGSWIRLSHDGNNYALDAMDSKMNGTWNGSTDMLRRCIQYILSDENASVPVAAGTSWSKVLQVGKIPGTTHDVQAVDLAGNGKLLLFVASDKGDCLFEAGDEAFTNVTEKFKLHSASLLAVWGNFSGAGRLDLASYDGKTLTIWAQGADGTFTPVKAGGNFAMPENCLGMAAVAVPAARTPGLLLNSDGGAPLLLKPTGNNAFEAVALPAAAPALVKDFGAAQPCIVADFTGTGLVDVIVPYAKGGLLYRGNKDGFFDAPQSCGVAGSITRGKAAVCDLDGSGLLDVVLAGADGLRIYQNLGNGAFAESMRSSGEVSYKGQPDATCCAIGDFNNDSRQDLILSYQQQAIQVYFNRGFRSFGEEPKMELNEPPAQLEGQDKGQQAILLADLRGTGAQDLAIVLRDGTLWCAYNALADDGAQRMQVSLSAKSAFAGPLNVKLYKGERSLGAIPVRPGLPAFLGIEDKGAYRLKWTLPGGKEMSRDVTVEKSMDVVLEEGK